MRDVWLARFMRKGELAGLLLVWCLRVWKSSPRRGACMRDVWVAGARLVAPCLAGMVHAEGIVCGLVWREMSSFVASGPKRCLSAPPLPAFAGLLFK